MQHNKFKQWVNQEYAKELDKEPFSSLPLRMRTGIFIMLGSWLTGYGTPVVLWFHARINHLPYTGGLVKGSVVYVLSYITGTVGLFLAGKDSVKYPIYFFAKLLKLVFPKYFKTETGGEPHRE